MGQIDATSGAFANWRLPGFFACIGGSWTIFVLVGSFKFFFDNVGFLRKFVRQFLDLLVVTNKDPNDHITHLRATIINQY